MTMESIYYVYVLFRETGLPFYVGMGKGNRWESHELRCHRRSTHKDRLIKAILEKGFSVPKVKIRENLTKLQAFEIEISLIAAIGREPHGPLINQTSGGDGVPGLADEVRRRIGEKNRQRLAGVPRSAEVKAKITATKRARAAADLAQKQAASPEPKKPQGPYRHTEETRRKIAEAGRGRPQTAEKSQKISAALRGRKFSIEHRANISAAQTGRVQPKASVAARTAKSRAAYMLLSPEKRSEITQAGWETRRRKACERESEKSFT